MDKKQVKVVLYILSKQKNIGAKTFRTLYDKNFDFVSIYRGDIDYIKRFRLPVSVVDDFKLYDYSKAVSYISQLENEGVRLLSVFDDEYPRSLRNIYDFPMLLYAIGDISLLNIKSPSIAVVGTRKCTDYGRSVTEEITSGLVSSDIMVVSGMADGIDSVAHQVALENNGKTIAVLGGGFDHIYPKKNMGLFEEIARLGLVISEHEPRVEPRPMYFPLRNRIVTGLSDGVLIVEGDIKSGAMISAYQGLEQGREVFAVPGNIDSIVSRGPNKLIKEGAKLTQSVSDILEEQPFSLQQDLFASQKTVGKVSTKKRVQKEQENKICDLYTIIPEGISSDQVVIMKCLSSDLLNVDSLADHTSLSLPALMSNLLELEVLGYIKQHPGKMFSLA